jgi:hypothetical protein
LRNNKWNYFKINIKSNRIVFLDIDCADINSRRIILWVIFNNKVKDLKKKKNNFDKKWF